jgi:transcriptional regulator
MYIPGVYQEKDREAVWKLIEQFNFATLVTVDNGMPFATHLPFMLDRTRGEQGTLLAHMAHANPQWRHFTDEQEVLIVFQGAHAYISPAWYKSEFAVPTWNYAVVHVYGIPRIIDDQEVVQEMLHDLVAYHEAPRPQPWDFTWSDRHLHLLKGIVAFQIAITRLEGKSKLSQNRQLDERSTDGLDRQVATMMTANLPETIELNH